MGQKFCAPQPLRPKSVVRLIRPAGAYDDTRLFEGTAWLRAQGLVPVDSGPLDDAVGGGGYYAGSLEARVAELKAALMDADAQALWAVRGGSGTAQLLPHVAQELEQRLTRAPMWLIGFSDITALHGAFAAHHVMSLHGAHVVSVMSWDKAAQRELLGHLGLGLGGQKAASPSLYPCTPLKWRHAGNLGGGEGEVMGPLVGGNLTVLASLCGTGMLPSWRGCVVFLEEIDERPYRIDRCLHQLVAAGAFDGARAVVFGQLTRCDAISTHGDNTSYTALELIEPTLRALGLPVVTGLPVGHEPSSRSLVLGATARLHTGGTQLEVCP